MFSFHWIFMYYGLRHYILNYNPENILLLFIYKIIVFIIFLPHNCWIYCNLMLSYHLQLWEKLQHNSKLMSHRIMPPFLIIPSLVISRIVLTKYLLGWRADNKHKVSLYSSHSGMLACLAWIYFLFGYESVSDPCFTYFTNQLLDYKLNEKDLL